MRKLSFFFGLVACAVMFLFVSSTPAFAQGETGSVDGVVLDSQGAAVAGADVTLIDTATKSPRTTTTNESGRYHFAFSVLFRECNARQLGPSVGFPSDFNHRRICK